MFATSARAVPAIFNWPVLDPKFTSEPFTSTSTPSGRMNFSVPFGPLTVIASLATLHSTPLGSATGFLATRDICLSEFLGDGAEHFAAHAFGACLYVGHQAGRGRDDGNAQTGHHLRQFVFVAVNAQTGTADAIELFDRRTAFEILQRDLQLGLVVLELVDLVVANVAFVFQQFDDGYFQFGCRHAYRRLRRRLRVADAGKHVGNGISHAHYSIPVFGIDIAMKTLNLDYQLALRRPGTSPRMVASRSL